MHSHIFDQMDRLHKVRRVSFWYGVRSKHEMLYVEDFNCLQVKRTTLSGMSYFRMWCQKISGPAILGLSKTFFSRNIWRTNRYRKIVFIECVDHSLWTSLRSTCGLILALTAKTTCWMTWADKFYLLNVFKSRCLWGDFSLLKGAAEKYASAVDHIALRLWLTAV